MRRVSETRLRINPSNQFPERLRIVRAASVSPRGVTLNTSAFVSDGRRAWRPGMAFTDARPVNAESALRRHAEHAAHVGIFAEGREGKRAA
jgi:hypothetical protein